MAKLDGQGPQRGLKAFLRSKGGNVAMLWTLSVIPIICVIGIAVDMNRSKNARLHVQDALDAAVLAAARVMQVQGESSAVDQQVNEMFRADLRQIGLEIVCDDPVTTKSTADRTLSASVHCDLETRIMPVFGTDELSFTRTSKAAYSINMLEVAFMFDVSGSMSGQKLVDLKDAAHKGFDILFDLPAAATGDMRIGVTTFATAVNAGSYFHAVTNLSNPRTGLHDTNPNDGHAATSVTTSGTCVTERTGADAYAETPPGAGHWFPAKNDVCPTTSILPLTTSRTAADNAVSNLNANGYTAGHLGIAWTWYLLSPEWTGVWPAQSDPKPYNTPTLSKVAVLMTDGEFNSAYESSNGSTATQALAICNAMKARGITVYAVVFDAPQVAKDLMQQCASPSSFYTADNGDQLEQAYRSIAIRISRLRIAS
jgi:Flp pilus assembly protein TadG